MLNSVGLHKIPLLVDRRVWAMANTIQVQEWRCLQSPHCRHALTRIAMGDDNEVFDYPTGVALPPVYPGRTLSRGWMHVGLSANARSQAADTSQSIDGNHPRPAHLGRNRTSPRSLLRHRGSILDEPAEQLRSSARRAGTRHRISQEVDAALPSRHLPQQPVKRPRQQHGGRQRQHPGESDAAHRARVHVIPHRGPIARSSWVMDRGVRQCPA